jgi:YhcH/YjgK/YiaL family protein
MRQTMIVDAIENAALYHGVHPRLAAAFQYLAAFDPATPDGRYPIDEDRVYAQVQTYATKAAAEKKWESHRRYADVQYIVAGRERIPVAPSGAMAGATEYNDAKDVTNYTGPSGASGSLYVEPGQFAVFLPHDAHQPGVSVAESEEVRKVVVKVLL